jgi:dATP pyrophosphohydrolase
MAKVGAGMSYRQPVQVLVHPVRWTDEGWQYLMLHRIPRRGGFWQGVSGGVEWGEALADAARRELSEETGLSPRPLQRLDCSYTFPMQDEWLEIYPPGTREVAEHVFLAVVEGLEPTLSPDEHDAWRWCTFEEALALLAWPENVVALRCCQSVLATLEADHGIQTRRGDPSCAGGNR